MWAVRLLDGSLPIVGGGLLGRRDAELSFVHADDAAAAFVAAIDTSVSGRYHIVDDEPIPGAVFFRTCADYLGAPAPRQVPGWLARFFVGTVSVNLLTSPMPTTNEHARRDLEWNPTFPTHREGLAHVVETRRETGAFAELAGASS